MTEPVTEQSCGAPDPGQQCGGPGLPDLSGATHDFLKALASEQRQEMMKLFTGGIELAVGTVAERMGIGQSNASQQLALLRRGGLLTSRRDGKQVRYRVDTVAIEKSLAELGDYLRRCCPP